MLHISVEREGQAPKELRFAKNEVVVGRDDSHDLQLNFEDGASRQHARLIDERGQVFVEDLGSRNGTKVNGKRISGKTPVSAGDVIEVGKVKIRLAGQTGAAAAPRAAQPRPAKAAEPAPEPARPARPAKQEPARAEPAKRPGPSLARSSKPAPVDPGDTSVRVNLKAAPEPEPAAESESAGRESGPVHDENEACRSQIDPLARRWRDLGRPDGLLLHGPLLTRGLAWIASDRKLRPRPSELHREFVYASRTDRRARVRQLSVGGSALAFALVGGSVTARTIHDDLTLSDAFAPGGGGGAGQCAPDNAVIVRANLLAQKADELTDIEQAILGGVRALIAADGPCARQSNAERVLRAALSRQRSRVIGRRPAGLRDADVGRDERDVVVVDADGAVMLWDRTGATPEKAITGSDLGRVAALGPEGRWLAVGTASGAVDLWDLSERTKPVRFKQLEGHRDPVSAISFSEDGRWLASGDRRGAIRIWDMRGSDAGNALGELRAHTGAIERIVFRDGGQRLYSLGGKQAYAWDLAEGKRKGKQLLLGIGGDVTAFAVNGEGDEIVLGDHIGQVVRWKVRTLARATTDALARHEGPVVDVAFVPREKAVLSLGTDKQLIVTELTQVMREGSEPLRVGLRGLTAEPLALAADPTGRRIAVAAADNKIYVWDVQQRHTSAQPLVPFDEHTDKIVELLPSYDGNSLISASEDGTLRLWPLQSTDAGGALAVLSDHRGPVIDVALSSDGGRMISSGQDKTLRGWRIDAAGIPRRVLERSFDAPVGAIALSADGRWAAAGLDRQIQIWNLGNVSGERDPKPLERSSHNDGISHIAFSADNRWMVTADYAGQINTWQMRQDGPEDSPTRTWSLGRTVTALALAPSTAHFAAATADNKVRLLPMTSSSGATDNVVAEHEKNVLALAFRNDGEYLVSTGDDLRSLLRQVDKGNAKPDPERPALPHEARIRAAAFSPDKRWLATGSDDGAIKMWDFSAGKEPKQLPGHSEPIVALVFEPNSELLISASMDKTARLWLVDDVDRGGEIRPIELSGHSGPINALRMDGGGRLVVTASADGSIRIWPLKHDLLIALACRAVGRDFREDEWSALYPGEPIETLCVKR